MDETLAAEGSERKGSGSMARRGWLLWAMVPMWLLVNAFILAIPRGDYEAIVVHHSASERGDYRSIRQAHHRRGWFETAYHLVLSNGSTGVPRGHLEPTWRYRLGLWSVATRNPAHNMRSLHVCIVGNYDSSPMPRDLQRSLGSTLATLQDRHGLSAEKIFLHRDCSATACPGRHVSAQDVRSWAAEGLAQLQAGSSRSLHGLEARRLLPWHYWGFALVMNAAMGMAWWRFKIPGRRTGKVRSSLEAVDGGFKLEASP